MANPLCERCKKFKKIKKAELVHHKISVDEIIEKGGTGLEWDNLESLCICCHNAELQKKRGDVEKMQDVAYIMQQQGRKIDVCQDMS